MLLSFGVANYRSIRDYQEILLTSTPSSDRWTMPASVVDASVVPAAVLFGANASGKSNLLAAMVDMRRLIVESHKKHDETDQILRSPFRLDVCSRSKPTRFECSFTLETGADESPVYDLDIEFTDHEICRERLRRTVRHERRSTHTLYTRRNQHGKAHVEFGVQLLGENKITANLTRSNSLFLSAAAQNNHPQLTEIHRWFSNNLRSLLAVGPISESSAARAVADRQNLQWLDGLLQQAGAGVGGIEVSQREFDERSLKPTHVLASSIVDHATREEGLDLQGFANERADETRMQLHLLHQSSGSLLPLDYGLESRGTRMFLTLVLSALDSLSKGSVLIIDELASSLHPRLAGAFVSLFLRPESNPNGAQLIFSTHDVTLLGSGRLSKDAVWLADKDGDGVSTFTPLSDYKLRGDFEKAYRNGRVGGSPDLHQFFLDLRA